MFLGALLLTAIAAVFQTSAHAADEAAYVPASPRRALLSPGGGRLEVVQELDVQNSGGQTWLEFVIPEAASNLQITVPGQTVSRWSSLPVLMRDSSALASIRGRVEEERIRLTADLAAVNARLAVWQALPQNADARELVLRQEAMAENMPALAREKEALEKRLELVRGELARLPDQAGIGQRIRVMLADGAPNEGRLGVEYSYDLAACGWDAVYAFNARPDEGDLIDVQLLAEVWQFTGMDWLDTQITLATRGNGPREPAPLKKWIVDSSASPRPQPRAAVLSAMAKNADGVVELAAGAPRDAGVSADSAALYATWTLSSRGLPCGRSRLRITADAWKAPLQWLARPSAGDSRVWLLARYSLGGNKAWPSGRAEYSVNGQSVGDGAFAPKGDEATLYFGADPRVNVHTNFDSKKIGESGFISSSKDWTWAWTYTISNAHAKPVRVRVERPAPMIVDESVSVVYKDKPKSRLNEKEHMVFWDVDVPAHGKADIEHSVTISSPTKLQLSPDVP